MKKLTLIRTLAILVVLIVVALGVRNHDIGKHLIADFLWTLVLACVGLILYGHYLTTNKMLDFFGLKPGNHSACIYISNVHVKRQGTTALEEITDGYNGPAISKVEYQAALLLQYKLAVKPMAFLPEELQEWIGDPFLRLKHMKVKIALSPRDGKTASDPDYGWPKTKELIPNCLKKDATIIILGGSAYNSISKWYLEETLPKSGIRQYFTFGKKGKDRFIEKHNIDGASRIIDRQQGDPNSKTKAEPACIMKFHDNGKTVFVVAGVGAWATAAGVRYLVENWEVLRDRFGKNDFGIELKCVDPIESGNHEAIDIGDIKVVEEQDRGFEMRKDGSRQLPRVADDTA